MRAGDVQDLCKRLQDMTAAARSAPLLTLDWGAGAASLAHVGGADGGQSRIAGVEVATGQAGVTQQGELEVGQGCEESQLDRQGSSGDEWQLV